MEITGIQQQYCLGCMRKRKPVEIVCPMCGYRHGREANPSNALPLGSNLAKGRYFVGKLISQGAYGKIYLGLDRSLDLRVAIKERIMRETAFGRGQSGKNNFVEEARRHATIDLIPGIVPVRDVFYENNTAYIVESYVEGRTLSDFVRDHGKMTAIDCLELLFPIMATLERVHNQNVVHCDISPSNILVDRYGEKWVIDWGSARTIGECQREVLITGGPVKPPELFSGKPVGPWTDIYSLCILICFCIGVDFRDAATVPLIGEILQKGMLEDIHSRYQSMNEFSEALKKAMNIRDNMPALPKDENNSSGLHPSEYKSFDEVFTTDDYYGADFLSGALHYELFGHFFSSEEYGYYVYLGPSKIGDVSEFNVMLSGGCGFRMSFGKNHFLSDYNFHYLLENKGRLFTIQRNVYVWEGRQDETSKSRLAAKMIFRHDSCSLLLIDGSQIIAREEDGKWNFYKDGFRVASWLKFEGDTSLPQNCRGYDTKDFDFYIFESLTSLERMIILGFPMLNLSHYCALE